ncbi:hypothetical protein KNJ79_05180 [Sphingopyxis indica]|uniref:hypothetical protein n=1 Tax=Sphingopyxis indica TaxID=436663 RepID=UPI002939230E|nr:hypothetical protein [Sphingopyxis indica]WOF44325.1 hypothetical protein KNJ79_05180 [Sphingopyxis indica]
MATTMPRLRLDRWSKKESQILTEDGSRLICLATENDDAQRIVDLWNAAESGLRLYLVAQDDGADNWDLFVWAHSPEEARDLWFNAWEYEEMPDDVRVFEVPTTAPSKPLVLQWFQEVRKAA